MRFGRLPSNEGGIQMSSSSLESIGSHIKYALSCEIDLFNAYFHGKKNDDMHYLMKKIIKYIFFYLYVNWLYEFLGPFYLF